MSPIAYLFVRIGLARLTAAFAVVFWVAATRVACRPTAFDIEGLVSTEQRGTDRASDDSIPVEAVNAELWPSLHHVRWHQWQNLQSGRPLKPGPFVASSATHSRPVRCLTSKRTIRLDGLSGHGEVNIGLCQTLSTKLYDNLRQFTEPDMLAKITSGVEAEICKPDQACLPVDTEADQLFTRKGHIDVVYVRRCGCTPKQNEQSATSTANTMCQVSESQQVFFKGTVFKQSINIGVCSGKCSNEGGSCVPTHTKTRTVSGPNGCVLVSSVVKCGCAPPCYRVPYHKAYPIVDESGQPAENQVIDVGQCAEVKRERRLCSDFRKSNRASMRFLGQCEDASAAGADSSGSVCQPSRVRTEHIRVGAGQWKQVKIISACSLINS